MVLPTCLRFHTLVRSRLRFALSIPFTAALCPTISALVTRLAPVIPRHRLARMRRHFHDSEVARRYSNGAAVYLHCLRWNSLGDTLIVGTVSFGFTMESAVAPHTRSLNSQKQQSFDA